MGEIQRRFVVIMATSGGQFVQTQVESDDEKEAIAEAVQSYMAKDVTIVGLTCVETTRKPMCRRCGRAHQEQDNFCPECGAVIEK